MRFLLITFATIHIALADCETLKDDETRAFFYMNNGESHPEGSTALLICKHGDIRNQKDNFMTCQNGNWTPAAETFEDCSPPAGCDVTELQQYKKLNRYQNPYGTAKVNNGQLIHGYCSAYGEEDRITYYCDNGKWTVKDTCE